MAWKSLQLFLVLLWICWRVAGVNGGFWDFFSKNEDAQAENVTTSHNFTTTTTTAAPGGFWNFFSITGNKDEGKSTKEANSTESPPAAAGSWWPNLNTALANFNKAISEGMVRDHNSTSGLHESNTSSTENVEKTRSISEIEEIVIRGRSLHTHSHNHTSTASNSTEYNRTSSEGHLKHVHKNQNISPHDFNNSTNFNRNSSEDNLNHIHENHHENSSTGSKNSTDFNRTSSEHHFDHVREDRKHHEQASDSNSTDLNRISSEHHLHLEYFHKHLVHHHEHTSTDSNSTDFNRTSSEHFQEHSSMMKNDSDLHVLEPHSNSTVKNGTELNNSSAMSDKWSSGVSYGNASHFNSWKNTTAFSRKLDIVSFLVNKTEHKGTEHGAHSSNSSNFETAETKSNETFEAVDEKNNEGKSNRSSSAREILLESLDLNAAGHNQTTLSHSSNRTRSEEIRDGIFLNATSYNETSTNQTKPETRETSARMINGSDSENDTGASTDNVGNSHKRNWTISCPECSAAFVNETHLLGNATTANRNHTRTSDFNSTFSNTSDFRITGFSIENKTAHFVYSSSSEEEAGHNGSTNGTSNREHLGREIDDQPSNDSSDSMLGGFTIFNGTIFAVDENGEIRKTFSSEFEEDKKFTSHESSEFSERGVNSKEPDESTSGAVSNHSTTADSNQSETDVADTGSHESPFHENRFSEDDGSSADSNTNDHDSNVSKESNSSHSVVEESNFVDNSSSTNTNSSFSVHHIAKETDGEHQNDTDAPDRAAIHRIPLHNDDHSLDITGSEQENSGDRTDSSSSPSNHSGSSEDGKTTTNLNDTNAPNSTENGNPLRRDDISSEITGSDHANSSEGTNSSSEIGNTFNSGRTRTARSFIPFSDEVLKPFMVISNLNQTSTPPTLLTSLQKEDLLNLLPTSAEISKEQKDAFLQNSVYDIGASLDALSEKDKLSYIHRSPLVEQLNSFPGKNKYVILPFNWWSKFVIDKTKPHEHTSTTTTEMPTTTTEESTTEETTTTTTESTSTTEETTTTTTEESTTEETTTTTTESTSTTEETTTTTTESTSTTEETTTTEMTTVECQTTETTTRAPTTVPYYPPVPSQPVYSYEPEVTYHEPNQVQEKNYEIQHQENGYETPYFRPTPGPVMQYPEETMREIFPYGQQVVPLENMETGSQPGVEKNVIFQSPEEMRRLEELLQGKERGPAVFQQTNAEDYQNPEDLGSISRGGYRQGKEAGLEYYEQVYAPPPDLVENYGEQQEIVLCPDVPALPCPKWMTKPEQCRVGFPCKDPLLICCLVSCNPVCIAGIRVPNPQPDITNFLT